VIEAVLAGASNGTRRRSATGPAASTPLPVLGPTIATAPSRCTCVTPRTASAGSVLSSCRTSWIWRPFTPPVLLISSTTPSMASRSGRPNTAAGPLRLSTAPTFSGGGDCACVTDAANTAALTAITIGLSIIPSLV
jgi:hypothetical protein